MGRPLNPPRPLCWALAAAFETKKKSKASPTMRKIKHKAYVERMRIKEAGPSLLVRAAMEAPSRKAEGAKALPGRGRGGARPAAELGGDSRVWIWTQVSLVTKECTCWVVTRRILERLFYGFSGTPCKNACLHSQTSVSRSNPTILSGEFCFAREDVGKI